MKTARRYLTITIQAGDHTVTAAALPEELATAIAAMSSTSSCSRWVRVERAVTPVERCL